jgi:exodeoxyribonuclease VII large subunit
MEPAYKLQKHLAVAEYLPLSKLLEDFESIVKENYAEKTFWVIAEIAHIKISQKNHCFLELVEKENNEEEIKAKIDAIIWAENFYIINQKFRSVTGEDLRQGIKILFSCYIDFHKVFGLRLIILDIKPEFTIGEMQLKKQAIIEKIHQLGLDRLNKLKYLPPVIQKIAIVSSATSAGLKDFITHLENNPYGFKFYYHTFEAIMQGELAKESITYALEKIKNYKNFFEVVVIIRGGGSKVDLACFDNFELSEYIANYPIPVITGIGHTEDISCMDLVAYLYLKTPTDCAQFIIQKMSDFYLKLQQQTNLLVEKTKSLIANKNHSISKYASEFVRKTQLFLHRQLNKLLLLTSDLEKSWKIYSQKLAFMLNTIEENLTKAVKIRIQLASTSLNEIDKKTKLLDPQNILKKGYSITYYKNKPITSTKFLKKNAKIVTKLYRGSFTSRVETVSNIKGEKNGRK